jgi:hypothetical protein
MDRRDSTALLLLLLFPLTLGLGFEISEDLVSQVSLLSATDSDYLPSLCHELRWGLILSDEDISRKIRDMMPELSKKGLEPAIPIDNLAEYQRLPLTDCTIQDGEFKFQVDVPAKPKNQDFQLYNFPAGSFSFETEAGVCYFDYPTKGIVETSTGSSIFPLSEEEFQTCIETSICQIPTSDEENYGDYVCLKAVFSGKTGRELAPYCKFHCHPHPVVSRANDRRQEISESYFFSWILK